MNTSKEIVLVCLGCALALGTAGGCAYTSIEKTPEGEFRYVSTRDTAIGTMTLTRLDDGSVDLELHDATGGASPVIDAQRELMSSIIEAAIEASLRAGAAR